MYCSPRRASLKTCEGRVPIFRFWPISDSFGYESHHNVKTTLCKRIEKRYYFQRAYVKSSKNAWN